MNLYGLHSNPEELHGFDIVMNKNPIIAYDLVEKNPVLTPKLEPYLMKDPGAAFLYARNILERRWPEAEANIFRGKIWGPAYKAFFKA